MEELRPDVFQQYQIHFFKHIKKLIQVTDRSINDFMQPVDSGNVSFNVIVGVMGAASSALLLLVENRPKPPTVALAQAAGTEAFAYLASVFLDKKIRPIEFA